MRRPPFRGGRLPRREDHAREEAARRLSTVSEGQVLVWAETAINGFHQNLDLYRRPAEREVALAELRKAVSMLAGAVDVLERNGLT